MIILLFAVLVVGVPTSVAWRPSKRARVPRCIVAVFLLAGWLTIFVGWALSQRAQPFRFPETSPCDRSGTPVSQYYPPDSFCRHTDGELRTVNGPNAQLLFWTAHNTALAMLIAAAFARRHQQA